MKPAIVITLLSLLCSCFSRPNMMTGEDFAMVQIGMPYKGLKEMGDPYVSRMVGDQTTEYEYIERIYANNRLIAENHYFIMVKEGKVIGKRTFQERPPAYDIIYSEDPNFTPP